MSNEDAIEIILYNLLDRGGCDSFDEKDKEALHMAVEALEQQPCDDCVSRAEMEKIVGSEFVDLQDGTEEWRNYVNDTCLNILDKMKALPSVTPKFTDEEIQKMQELEQAQLEKAYELGMQTSFEEWLKSFNTDSATECFVAVQGLKKKMEKGEMKNED